jgi:hypothetical protein
VLVIFARTSDLKVSFISSFFRHIGIPLTGLRQPDDPDRNDFSLAVIDNAHVETGSLQHGRWDGQFLWFNIRLVIARSKGNSAC